MYLKKNKRKIWYTRYSLREIKKLHEANAVISNYHRHPDDSKIPAVKRAFRISNRIILFGR